MLVLLTAALLALTPPQTSQNNAVIEGRVLRPGSMEPIPNVQVTMTAPPPAGGSPQTTAAAAQLANRIQSLIAEGNQLGVGQAAIDNAVANAQASAGAAAAQQTSALTDGSGHFSFRDLAPGRYTLRATREGFFGPPINGSAPTTVTKTVTIESQKPVPAADIFMVQGGVISGRIRDPNGQPASGLTVAATRVTYSNGRPQWSTVNSKQTDDRGIYRIFGVPPGEYNVGITPRAISTIPSPQDSWARTFYPGVSDPTAANTLAIKDGTEVDGVDFTIQTYGTVTYKITGKAINPLAVRNATSGVVDQTINSFILAPREPGILDPVTAPSVQNALAPAARPNGEFEIRNVRPGSYDLIAYYMPPLPLPASPPLAAAPGTPVSAPPPPYRRYNIGRVRVDVRNSDVEGITLQIQRGTEINGKVISQGTAAVPLDKIRINLHSQDTIPDSFATIVGAIPVDTSGSFTVSDIVAAKYTLQISGLPDSAYVAEIRQGSTTVFDTGLTVGDQPVTTVEILVNSNGATVEGHVQGSDRKPAANATVVLVPPARHRQNTMMYKTTQTDETGHFLLKAIPPGDFTLFAWENVLPTAWMNADFLAKFQNRGRPVTVTQGTRIDTQLELIPDESNRR